MSEQTLRIEKVVVTGGRSFRDTARIEADLRALLPLGLRRLAHGGAIGADRRSELAWLAARTQLSREERDRRGLSTEAYPAEWDRYGDSAGPRRNVRMLEAEKPDLVLAYPDTNSRGTWHCVSEALKRGVPVAVWAPWCAPRPHTVDTNGPLPCSWLASDELGRVIFGPKTTHGVLLLRALEVAGA